MKKVLTCTVASIAVVITLLFIGVPKAGPRRAGGDEYWQAMLRGEGVELRRGGGRIEFGLPGRHGWRYRWSDVHEVDRAMPQAVRRFIAQWLNAGWRGNRESLFDEWDWRRFAALTGYQGDGSQGPPLEWWHRNRDVFSPTLSQVRAFLKERDTQIELRHKLGKGEDGDLGPEAARALWRNPAIARAAMWRSPPRMDRVLQGQVGSRVWRNFAFEAVYFPLLVFYLSYAVPYVRRRIEAGGHPAWYCWGIAMVLAYWGIVLPHTLGYSPDWGSTTHDKGTIFYNAMLTLPALPVVVTVQLLGITVPFLVMLPSALLDAFIPPVLWWFNSYCPSPWANGSSGLSDRGVLFVWGTMMYWLIGAVYGRDVARRRKKAPPSGHISGQRRRAPSGSAHRERRRGCQQGEVR